MTTDMALAVTSLDDFSRWARSDGLEIILLVSGSILFDALCGVVRGHGHEPYRRARP